MKGKISLKDFINEVKDELRASVDDVDPFFIMGDVELEVTFGLEVEGGASARLVVLDVSGAAKGIQTHTVKLKLTPFVAKQPAAPHGDHGGFVDGVSEATPRSAAAGNKVVTGPRRPTAKVGGFRRPTCKSADVKSPRANKLVPVLLGGTGVGKRKPKKHSPKEKR